MYKFLFLLLFIRCVSSGSNNITSPKEINEPISDHLQSVLKLNENAGIKNTTGDTLTIVLYGYFSTGYLWQLTASHSNLPEVKSYHKFDGTKDVQTFQFIRNHNETTFDTIHFTYKRPFDPHNMDTLIKTIIY